MSSYQTSSNRISKFAISDDTITSPSKATVKNMALSPMDTHIAFFAQRHDFGYTELQLWDVAQSEIPKCVKKHGKFASSFRGTRNNVLWFEPWIQFSPCGSHVVCVYHDYIDVLNVKTLQQTLVRVCYDREHREHTKHTNNTRCVSVFEHSTVHSSGGKHMFLVSFTSDLYAVHVWDITKLVEASPNAAAGRERDTILTDKLTPKLYIETRHSQPIKCCAHISTTSNVMCIATGSTDKTVRIYTCTHMNLVDNNGHTTHVHVQAQDDLVLKHDKRINSCAFICTHTNAPDNTLLLTVSDRRLRVWHVHLNDREQTKTMSTAQCQILYTFKTENVQLYTSIDSRLVACSIWGCGTLRFCKNPMDCYDSDYLFEPKDQVHTNSESCMFSAPRFHNSAIMGPSGNVVAQCRVDIPQQQYIELYDISHLNNIMPVK